MPNKLKITNGKAKRKKPTIQAERINKQNLRNLKNNDATIIGYKKKVLMLFMLYTIQGFPMGFFGQAVYLILAEKGIDMTELAVLGIISYPFTFKFLFAPFQDAHYSKSFGKHKSYIVPIQYLMAILLFMVSFQIETLLQQKEISKFVIIGFIGYFLSATQDIAVDSLVLSLFENEKHSTIGSTCNNIGHLLGTMITGPIFIQLNSLKFCNENIYSSPQNSPLISTSGFLQIIAFIIGSFTILFHFFFQERDSSTFKENNNNEQEREPQSIINVLKKLMGFYTNVNLRFLVILLLLSNLGIFTVYASFGTLLIKQGYPKEYNSTNSTLLIPFTFIANILANKFIGRKQEMHTWRNSFIYQIILSIIGYFIITLNPVINDSNSSTLFYVIQLYLILVTFNISFRSISIGGFFNRISDEDTGGSSLTFLNSASNLGAQLNKFITLIMQSQFTFTTVAFSGLAVQTIYLLFMSKRIIPLQKIPKRQWKLGQINKT